MKCTANCSLSFEVPYQSFLVLTSALPTVPCAYKCTANCSLCLQVHCQLFLVLTIALPAVPCAYKCTFSRSLCLQVHCQLFLVHTSALPDLVCALYFLSLMCSSAPFPLFTEQVKKVYKCRTPSASSSLLSAPISSGVNDLEELRKVCRHSSE